MTETTLEQVLDRHRAFWSMEEVDEPLLSVGRYHDLQKRQPFRLMNGELVGEGERLLPDKLDVRYFAEYVGEPKSSVRGDFVQSRAPYDLCWMEAIAGCPIYWRRGSPWSEPFLTDAEEAEQIRPAADNPWLNRLLEMTALLVERANGRYPISQPLLRGPIDIAAAALGDEPLCWVMLTEPDQFHEFLGVCTDAFLEVATRWLEATPPFEGGHSIFGIWAPGTVVRGQCDNASLLSPRLYEEFLIPCDERICAAFDYPVIHTHSGFIDRVADALLGTEGLRAIQVSIDYPAGPPVLELLSTFREINGHKPLIITGGVTQNELEMLLDSLSPRGLCLQVGLRQ